MSPIHNKAIAYRPEVDGLRTIAVLPVILFHAGFEFFSTNHCTIFDLTQYLQVIIQKIWGIIGRDDCAICCDSQLIKKWSLRGGGQRNC